MNTAEELAEQVAELQDQLVNAGAAIDKGRAFYRKHLEQIRQLRLELTLQTREYRTRLEASREMCAQVVRSLAPAPGLAYQF